MIHLSPREMEVVVCVGCRGWSYKATASELGITVSTVRVHANRVARKTGYNTRPRDALTRLYWEELYRPAA